MPRDVAGSGLRCARARARASVGRGGRRVWLRALVLQRCRGIRRMALGAMARDWSGVTGAPLPRGVMRQLGRVVVEWAGACRAGSGLCCSRGGCVARALASLCGSVWVFLRGDWEMWHAVGVGAAVGGTWGHALRLAGCGTVGQRRLRFVWVRVGVVSSGEVGSCGMGRGGTRMCC